MGEIKEKIILEVGLALVPVIGTGAKLKEKVSELRVKFKENNINLPLIHVYENPTIKPFNEIRIIMDKEIASRKEILIKQEEKSEQFIKNIQQIVEELENAIQKQLIERGEGNSN